MYQERVTQHTANIHSEGECDCCGIFIHSGERHYFDGTNVVCSKACVEEMNDGEEVGYA